MEDFITYMEQHPIFLAIMVIISTIGFRYIHDDIAENVHKILNCQLTRKLIMFAFIFCATRDLKISLLGTILYILLIQSHKLMTHTP